MVRKSIEVKKAVEGKAETRTTGVNLPARTHELLKSLALYRSYKTGERVSVSNILVDLVESNRERLEKEMSSN